MAKVVELKGLQEALDALDPGVAQKAAVATINDLTAKGRTRASTKIRSIYNVKAAPLKDAMKVFKLKNWGAGKASIETTGSRFDPFHFSGTRELAAGGLSVQIRKDRPRYRFRWPFVGVVRPGASGFATDQSLEGTKIALERVWRRERPLDPVSSRLTRRAPWSRFGREFRFPIRRFTTIGPADMFDVPPIYAEIQQLVDEEYEDGFRRNYEFYANR